MCGIAGWCNGSADDVTLTEMLRALRHRGPESAGAHHEPELHLGHARLSIVDVAGGQQPLTNEDETVWLIANGEIFNHLELRERLIAQGHRFRTHSDCEVLIHLYEERGPEAFTALNGQYAFALWDSRAQRLILCRDRVGICPLYYTFAGETLYFASEVKALLQVPAVEPRADAATLGSIWAFWSPLPGHTTFEGINEFPAAHYAVFRPGDRALQPRRYWQLDFTERPWTIGEAHEALAAALDDAVRLRLMADVPVSAYLSGGLDSSVTTALARRHTRDLHTFSIAFEHPDFDESAYQLQVAEHLGTQHHVLRCDGDALAGAVAAMVYHAEAPQLRAGPVSMYLLSGGVHAHDYKVVITGEGADEFLLGYDLFKETAVRRFLARDPASPMRRALSRRLYQYLPNRDRLQRGLDMTFQQRLDRVGDPLFSHHLRWSKVAHLQSYFVPELRVRFAPVEALERAVLAAMPDGFAGWHWAARAQAVEVHTFMTPYLLAAQGDRVAMAHSVEGRFPFLDHRVIELANSFPVGFKLRTLNDEKHILRRIAAETLPAEIAQRPKVPYRAPIQELVRAPGATYVDELLAPEAIAATGYFVPEAARRLLQRVRSGASVSEMDEMALFGIITTQLWHHTFLRTRGRTPHEPAGAYALTTGAPRKDSSVASHV